MAPQGTPPPGPAHHPSVGRRGVCRDQDDRQRTPSIAEEQLICKSSLICLFALVCSVRVWAEVDSLTQGLSSRADWSPRGIRGFPRESGAVYSPETLHCSPQFPSLASSAPHAWLSPRLADVLSRKLSRRWKIT